MIILAIIAAVTILAIIYFAFAHLPQSDLIFSSVHEEYVLQVKQLLSEHGIETYAKNMHSQGLVVRRGGEMANPSLHLINIADRQRALTIITNASLG